MKTLLKSCVALAAALALSTAAHAGSFSFSYLFGDGTQITGTLEGTQNGGFVENVTNVTLAINGTAVTGNLFLAHDAGGSWDNGAILAFDLTQSNFLFVNSDLVGGDFSYDGYFLVNSLADYAAGYLLPLDLNPSDAPLNPAAWSLTPTSASVPDSAPTLALLAVSALGLAAAARRRAAAL